VTIDDLGTIFFASLMAIGAAGIVYLIGFNLIRSMTQPIEDDHDNPNDQEGGENLVEQRTA